MTRHPDLPPWIDPDDPDQSMWWACDHPERPGDDDTVYHEQCAYCLLKLRADVQRVPETAELVMEHLAVHTDCPVREALS